MRYSYIFLGLFLFIISGCIKEKEQSDNDFITIDITDNYPLKELILQDIMDVEYIALETNETFSSFGASCKGNRLKLLSAICEGIYPVFDLPHFSQ